MKTFQKYQKAKKEQSLKVLVELSKRIKNGTLTLTDMGFWSSGLDNSVFFKISVLSRDSKKEIEHFGKF